MNGYWVIGICAFTFDVGSVSSHAVLDFLTCLPHILDAAESAFYQVNDIDGSTGDALPDLEGLLGGVACEGVGLRHVFTVFASG